MLYVVLGFDEGIRIGGEIRVIVSGISQGQVKLGIDAPKHIRVVRSELESGEKEIRTVEDVLEARGTVVGCCDRFANRMSCDCLEKAEKQENRGCRHNDVVTVVLPDGKRGVRCQVCRKVIR